MSGSTSFTAIRERAGLTVEQVAERAGCQVRTVYRWESGETKPRKLVLDMLEQAARDKAAPSAQGGDFTFVDLFAGIGGMRRAFEAVGGRCVATCEWDKYARQTYAANFCTVDHPFFGDIREVTKGSDREIDLQMPPHDVLVAGFPCQPFSIAGVSKKNALGRPHGFACEAQGTLFYDVAKIISVKRPRAFLLENVKNLVRHDRGNTFRVIMDVLRNELGYRFVDYRVIDAKGFVPQHRERTIIVGFREDAGFAWEDVNIPDAKKGPKLGTILHSADEAIDGRFITGPKGRVNPKYTLTDHLWAYLQNYAEKHRAAGNGFGFGLVTADDVARTLSARYYKDGSEILVSQGSRKNPRRLTPRECARLMGFDDGKLPPFEIPVSDTQAYKQFGNSVVVPVIESVARAVALCLKEAVEGRVEPRLPLFGSGLREPVVAYG
ncbi:DNA (cytosine-5-)-methyltransferase [Ferrovibrio sp.]|uniref:DNA (cytosine-5-)-methyltransferase n=1 Tax=Ferrovibrio sp. TaxID=1917215 RepID=UPI003515A421